MKKIIKTFSRIFPFNKYDWTFFISVSIICFCLIGFGLQLPTNMRWTYEELFNFAKILMCISITVKILCNWHKFDCVIERASLLYFFAGVGILASINAYYVIFDGEQIRYIFNMYYHLSVLILGVGYSWRMKKIKEY